MHPHHQRRPHQQHAYHRHQHRPPPPGWNWHLLAFRPQVGQNSPLQPSAWFGNSIRLQSPVELFIDDVILTFHIYLPIAPPSSVAGFAAPERFASAPPLRSFQEPPQSRPASTPPASKASAGHVTSPEALRSSHAKPAPVRSP